MHVFYGEGMCFMLSFNNKFSRLNNGKLDFRGILKYISRIRGNN